MQLDFEFKASNNKEYKIKVFETAWFMLRSQKDSYQGSTIWFCRKATLRRKIPRSLYWQSSTFEGLSLPITKTTQRN